MNRHAQIWLAIVTILFCAGFYWVAIRPGGIREYCLNSSVDTDLKTYPDLAGSDLRDQEMRDYQDCLILHGLDK